MPLLDSVTRSACLNPRADDAVSIAASVCAGETGAVNGVGTTKDVAISAVAGLADTPLTVAGALAIVVATTDAKVSGRIVAEIVA